MNIGVGEALLISLCGFVTVFLLLLFLIVVIKIISTVVMAIEGKGKTAPAPAAEAPAPAPVKEEEKPSKPWDGKLQLIDVDEETAACIMAIISDETDIPLDELQFRRIQAL
ncbi:OadG family transporter subunit [Butyricicoccus sp.]|uniref:OadG family transporter subunit n=1 Tax=Butyricicoccus sp. TaxID=2049021 RepID=UPI003F17039B